MKHTIITALITIMSVLGMYAQEGEGSKILVFRNTGEINIFNSDSIAKVELSVFDADSIAHDEFVSQVFHHKNTSAISIPLAEIDSVAFGYRNIIEPKPGVRRLTDEEAEAISSFDGETIIYDSRLTLNAGEIVYYDLITNTLPIALCVKVNNVREEGSQHCADVTMLDPIEVFDRYLVTGNLDEILEGRMKKADDYTHEPFELELPEVNTDGTKIEGKTIVNDFYGKVSEVVINPFRGYYHAKLSVHLTPHIEFHLYTPQKFEKNLGTEYEHRRKLCFPIQPSPLKVSTAFDFFMDLLAELEIEYEFETEYNLEVEWTRQNGKNTFSNPNLYKDDNGIESHQKIEAHIDGEVFAGVRTDACIHIPFRALGAGIEFKYGLKLAGELSAGIMADMANNFNPETYAKGEITLDHGFRIETYACYFNLGEFGFRDLNNLFQIDKTKLPFEWEKFWNLKTIKLFPEFNSRATLTKSTAPIVQLGDEPEAVSISSFIEEELPYPLKISYEIADKNSDKTLVETEVVDVLDKETNECQTIYSEIAIPSEFGLIDKDEIVARPIINYKGYKIKTAPANIAGDMLLTPNICSMVGGSTYFVSGMTPVSQHTIEETTYIEGNLVGYGVKSDPRYKKRKFKMYEFIDISDPTKCNGSQGGTYSLLGDWTGTIAGEEVSFTFSEEGKGNYNGTPFTYKCNSPQRGGIAIFLENGGTISFSIVDVSDDTLTILMKGTEEEAVLYRQ